MYVLYIYIYIYIYLLAFRLAWPDQELDYTRSPSQDSIDVYTNFQTLSKYNKY